MERQQSLTHSPVAPLRQIFERHPGPLTEDVPLLGRRSGNAFFRSSTHNPQRRSTFSAAWESDSAATHTARRGQNGRQDGGLQATKPLQLSCYGAAGSGVQLFVRRVEDNCCFALIF